jgi:two-component system, LytTR family, sensor kinase
MIQKQNRYYWAFQVSGWGLFALMIVLVNTFLDQKVDVRLVEQLTVMIFSGILTTHLFREFIRHSNWLLLPVEKAVPKFLIAIVVVCLVASLIRISIIEWLSLGSVKHKFDFPGRLLFFALEIGLFIIPWTLIYYFYHYIEKSRKQQLDTLKLEALVKELELKTIKSHINPHFIFNALNSIRALIDENPERARKAITELSNILRSSMQTEKQETVSFEKELNIVKDYLALEHIRFEDRLQVKYFIDEDTLDQPIPPMMLQTLVENAIKHGISKQLSGGTVTTTTSW